MSPAQVLCALRGVGLTAVMAGKKLRISPASALTTEQRGAIRLHRDALCALLEAEYEVFERRAAIMAFDGHLSRLVAEVAARPCVGCKHVLSYGTCAEPVLAGLITAKEEFAIVWPPEGHGAACPAFIGKMPTAAADRPHRLTNDEADRCHAPCWNDAEIAAFTARTKRFALLGRADADDLAERLTLRDRDGNDRRLCLECTWLGDTGRCLAAAAGRIPGADRRLEPVQTILQRCGAFGLRKGLV